jgi:hypothetical protein
MVKTRAMNPLRGENPRHDVCRKEACLKIPAQHGFRVRFALERAPCEESQRAGQRVLADFQSILRIRGDLIHRRFAIDPRGPLAALVVEKSRISQDLQAQEIVQLLPVPKAWRAAGGGWSLGGELLDGLENDEHALLAGGERGVAEEQAYPRASQRQGHREQALDLGDGWMSAGARRQQDVRPSRGGKPRLIPARAFFREQASQRTFQERFGGRRRRLAMRKNLPEQGQHGSNVVVDYPQITQMDADGPVTEYVSLALSLSASICDICGSFKWLGSPKIHR